MVGGVTGSEGLGGAGSFLAEGVERACLRESGELGVPFGNLPGELMKFGGPDWQIVLQVGEALKGVHGGWSRHVSWQSGVVGGA